MVAVTLLAGTGAVIPLLAGLIDQLNFACRREATEQGVHTGLPSGAAAAQMLHRLGVQADFHLDLGHRPISAAHAGRASSRP